MSRSTPTDDWEQIEDQVRRAIRVRDDFVRVPFPRVASIADRQMAEAVESYKREAAIVDPRLAHEVTCAFKATALSDLCDQLRADTGIQLSAGPSVADEKVTVFCEKLPLREVMRQLGRPFGYTWLLSQREGDEYRYELVQDLRSQLLEEELRNRDRDAALIALEKDLEQYRPFLDLSPDEALARAKTASPADKPLLEDLAGTAWGPLHLYFRLSSQEQAALRAGQELKFSEAPRPGEKPRPEMGGEVLPPEIARGVLQSVRFLRLIKTDEGWEYSPGDSPPAALPPAAIPEARAWVLLGLGPSDLSQFTFKATDGVFTIGPDGGVHLHASFGGGGRGRSSAHQKTNNAAANAALAHDPALGARVTVVPVASSPWAVVNEGPDRPLPGDKKVNSAEVLEALHQATGIPIVAHFYTRLFKRDAVSVRNQPLFEALNKLGDAMRVRWHKEGGWLQLRSLTFFDDRRKEVPNRLLSRWAESRRLHGALSLDDLVEIAQLPDAQLDAAELAEGAREWWGLAEWDLACSTTVRPHLRYLARLTPEQRRETMSATGLPFTGMSLAQQQQFMVFGLGDAPLRSLDELAGATLRVEYTQPGQFQWGEPGWSGYYTRWVIPLGPGPQDHRALRPPVTARTRQETLAAVRRVDPQLREALLQAVDRADPRTPQALDAFEEQQIFPTQRNLTFVYIPGATNARSIFVLSAADGLSGRPNYRLR